MRGSPPTKQSRRTAARKRRQFQRVTASLIAQAQASNIPVTIAPTSAPSLLDAILAGHSIRRV